MWKTNLPERWQEEIQNYLVEIGSKYKSLSIDNFSNDLSIDFDDGSYAFFHNAFYIVKKDWKEIAIFTEHNGYHIYPLLTVKIETIDGNSGAILNTEDFTIE